MATLGDFDEHKKVLLSLLRSQQPAKYFSTVMSAAPKFLNDGATQFDGYSEAQAAGLVARARLVVAEADDPRRTLAELDDILAADPAGRR